jgi:hypothetical protein|nr:MAG TPA: hypothetical protein [Caudoviricetes sp.]
MFKILFKSKIRTKTEYQVGDTVYLLAYPYRSYGFADRKEIQGLGEQIKLFKMKITKIIFDEKNKPQYFTNVKTGLENSYGGYYVFNSWEEIEQAISKFVDNDMQKEVKILEAEIEQLYEFIVKIQHLGEIEQQRLVNLESKGE